MSTPTPRTDAAYAKWQEGWDRTPFGPDLARTLERELYAVEATLASERGDHLRELAHERETSRLLKVAMDVRDEGYTQSCRRMSALESEVTAKGQAVRNLAEVISGQDKELERERAKVRTLREACESIEEQWDKNHSASPFHAGNMMQSHAMRALAATEDAT